MRDSITFHEALEHKLHDGRPLTNTDVEAAAIEGAVQRLRPKLMTVCAVLASLAPILWEPGIGSDYMKPIAAPIIGGMITSTIHVLILVPVFFVMMKERALRRGRIIPRHTGDAIVASKSWMRAGSWPWQARLTGSLFLSYIDRVSTVDRLPDNDRLELLQGTLEVLILRSLKLEPNHAYGISQFLQQQSESEFLVDNGSLYPALQRLLQREWISAQWKTSPNGRRARYYSLTPAGRKQLVKATSKWQRFALAMARILAPEG